MAAAFQVYKFTDDIRDGRYLTANSDGSMRWTLTRGDAHKLTRKEADTMAAWVRKVFIGHMAIVVPEDKSPWEVLRQKPRGTKLNPDNLDMEGHALAKHGGDHVELHPGLDLWMRGARYGTTKKISADGIVTVKMDHPGVKKLQRIPAARLKLTTNRNPRKRGRSTAQKAATARMLAANRRGRKRGANPGKRKSLQGFQVAALRGEKVLFLSGVALTDNRAAASHFNEVWVARKVAKSVRNVGRKLGVSKVAVVTKHDTAQEVRRFLLGGA